MNNAAESALSRFVWNTRYRERDAPVPEAGIDDTWRRVATAAASVEQDAAFWRGRFFDALRNFRFLPAGRILAGAGILADRPAGRAPVAIS